MSCPLLPSPSGPKPSAKARVGHDGCGVAEPHWKHKRALRDQELGELRARVRKGLSDIEAGRVNDFDAERIVRRGKQQLQSSEPSA
jgi:hypothetical protein